MQRDTLSRRLRFAPPQPLGKRIAVGPADMALFAAINRHGPLPTNFLLALSGGKNRNAFQYRLTKLFNGAEGTPPLLSRPPQQFQSFSARYQHLIYDLTPASRQLLADDGIAIIDRTDPFLHRFMGACVSASIEMGCTSLGLTYIDRAAVLEKGGGSLSLKHDGKTLIPDDLFGIRYPDGGYRFFAVEIDRNTESIERRKLGNNTYGRKLETYLAVLATGAFKAWGIPNLRVLTITTNAVHLRNLMQHLDKLSERSIKSKFLFKAKREFGMNWKVPDVMEDLLTEPWATTAGTFDLSK